MEFIFQDRDIFGTNSPQKLAPICAAAQMKFGVICAAGQVLKTKKKSLSIMSIEGHAVRAQNPSGQTVKPL